MNLPPTPKLELPTDTSQDVDIEGTMKPILTDNRKGIGSDVDEDVALLDRKLIKIMSKIPIYEVKDNVRQANGYATRSIGRLLRTLMPGQIFTSMQKLRATGLEPPDIEHLLRDGHIQMTTVSGIHMQIDQAGAPAVLGNTTGSREGDRDAGIGDGKDIPRNTPGVKWGYHPDGLSGLALSTLQTMIASKDPGIEVPHDKSGCIGILSSQFNG
jgi:hypothetical protein